jgi:hydrogenase-4 component F
MDWLLIALLAVPVAAAAVSILSPSPAGQAATVAAGILSLGLAATVAYAVRDGSTLRTAGGWLGLDPLGAVFLLPTGLLYAAAGIFSPGYLRPDRRERFRPFARRYFAYLNLFCWALLLVPLVTDFGTLWIAVELTTVISALLVALDRTEAALEASWKYVLIASAGLGIGLLGVILLYAAGTAQLGGDYLPRFHTYVDAAQRMPAGTVRFAFLLAVVGFGTKAGLAPMHTWLPDAHSEAPTPVSALLSGALLASALYAVLRFYQVTAIAGGAGFPRRVLIVFGVASLAVSALFVLQQEHYKRLLAYSSIEHVGLIALGIGFGTPLAILGALLHVINHAAAKGLAFFGAGSILRRYDTKQIGHVGDAVRVLPFTGPAFLFATLALSGLPVSGIFRSEFQIVAGGFARPQYLSVALLIVLVNVAFFGVVWHSSRMALSPAADPPVAAGETSRWMAAAMGLCLVVVVGLGLHVPGALSQLLHHAGSALAHPAG